MKLGVCTSPENSAAAAAAGFDYIEGSLTWLAGLEEKEYQALLEKAPHLPAPLLKCNSFAPGTVKLTGPEADAAVQRAYVEKAMSRAHAVGVTTLVLGSGAARNVPEGFSYDTAWRQFRDFLSIVGEYAEKYGLDVALEPLRRQECNLLNLVSEATLLAALVGNDHINVLGDTFHMVCCDEPLSSLTHAGPRLRHIHVSHPLADRSGRDFPQPGDGVDYAALFSTLRDMGYQGDVSIEAGCKDFAADGARAAAYLKPLMK